MEGCRAFFPLIRGISHKEIQFLLPFQDTWSSHLWFCCYLFPVSYLSFADTSILCQKHYLECARPISCGYWGCNWAMDCYLLRTAVCNTYGISSLASLTRTFYFYWSLGIEVCNEISIPVGKTVFHTACFYGYCRSFFLVFSK